MWKIRADFSCPFPLTLQSSDFHGVLTVGLGGGGWGSHFSIVRHRAFFFLFPSPTFSLLHAEQACLISDKKASLGRREKSFDLSGLFLAGGREGLRKMPLQHVRSP